MANDYSQYNPGTGFAGFNYNTESDILKRKQAIAQALLQQSTTPLKGQVIQNNMGTFFGGGNTPLTALAQIAASALSAKAMKDDDQSQRNLDATSNAALAYDMGDGSAQAQASNSARATQQAQEDAEQLQREGNRSSPSDPPDGVQGPTANPDGTGSFPVSDGSGQSGPVVPLPPVQPPQPPVSAQPTQSVTAAPSQALAKKAAAALQARAFDPGAGGADWDSTDDKPSVDLSVNPDNPGGTPLGDQVKGVIGLFKKMYGLDGSSIPQPAQAAAAAALAPQATTASAGPQQPQSPAAAQPTPPAGPAAMPPMPQPAPQGAAPQQPSPMPQPAPQAPPQQAPQTPPQQASPPAPPSLVDQAGMTAAPSQSDVIKQLLAVGQTGPLGQQLATAQLNQIFGSKNGRFQTDVKPDPVNGGFVAVTTDSATGQITNIKSINAGAGTMVTGQTTDANGNRLNVHKDGSTTPMLDVNGNPVKDAQVGRGNADAVTDLVSKRSDAQSKLADLRKMESDLTLASGLVGQANVGPLAGTVGGVYNKFLGNSTANDTLDRVLNDTRLQQILQDKGGQGTVGAGLMRAYQGHSMSRDLSPDALSQGLGQALGTVTSQRQALESQIAGQNYALGQMGYSDPSMTGGSTSTTRAPGTYKF